VTVIRAKAEFYRRWFAGLLGNRPRTWGTPEALLASGYTGTVSVRTVGPAGGKTRYNLTVSEAVEAARDWPGKPTFNESAPDHVLLIQGEVTRSVGGLYLRYSTTPGMKMNEAMRLDAHDASGLTAKLLLDHFLWPASRDDLDALLDAYPDHVVEFSAHGCACGDQPHRNMLVWEVRAY
jgi:hypothetical protein